MKKNKVSQPRLFDYGGKISAERNERWFIQCCYWDKDGKYQRKRYYEFHNIGTSAERYSYAQERMPKIVRELEAFLGKETLAPTVPKMIVGQAIEQLLVIKKAMIRPRSFHSYSSDIRCFVEKMGLKKLPLESVTRQHLLTYQEKLLIEGKKGKTINGYLTNIKTLFSDMVKRDWLVKNPFVDIPHLKEEKSLQNRAFTPAQIAQLRPLIQEQPLLSMAVQLMYYCFIRPSEIRGLQVQHINLTESHILIPAEVSKNGKSEFVTIPSCFKEELAAFIGKKGQKHYLLSSNGSTPLGRNTLSAQHRRILEKVGFEEEHTLYSWKHTGVVVAYQHDLDMKSIQRQCRHSSLQMTDIYLATLGTYVNTALLHDMPKW